MLRIPARRPVRLIVLLLLLCVVSLRAQRPSEDEARGFVGSVAKSVYWAAWPTATYKDWNLKSLQPTSAGLNLIVRLSGEGLLGDDLWVDLAFKFDRTGFAGIEVAGHNGHILPPFALTGALTKMAASLVDDYNAKHPTTYPEPPPPVTPRLPATHAIRAVNRCSSPVALWVRVRGSRGAWENRATWQFKANEGSILADSSNAELQLSSPQIWYYAEIPNGSYSWSGDTQIHFDDRTLGMRERTLTPDDEGVYQLDLNCDNFTAPTTPANSQPRLMLGMTGLDLKSANAYGESSANGVQVTGLMHGMAAEAAGLRVGDIIYQIDGRSVPDIATLSSIVQSTGQRMVSIGAWRSGARQSLFMTPGPSPRRQPANPEQCRESGNPTDYYLGALAAPVRGWRGYVDTPLYPATTGRLFEPSEIELYVNPAVSDELQIYYEKPVRSDIVSFEYFPWDHAILAVLASGDRLDLGVRVQCQIEPGTAGAGHVRLSRTQSQREVAYRVFPLTQVK